MGFVAGLRAPRGEYVAYMCPDGQIAPDDAVRTMRLAQECGPRHLVKVRRMKRGDGRLRKFVSRVYNFLFWLLFGAATADVNGTPKVLHRDDLASVDPRSKDWFIDAEIVIESVRGGIRIVEVPVDFLPRAEGKSHVRFSTTLEFLKNLLLHRLGIRK